MKRKKTMKHKMIEIAASYGWAVSVYAHEDAQCLIKKSTDFDAVVEHMESVDVADVVFYDGFDKCLGSVMVVNGLSEDEEIADYSWNPDICNILKEVFVGHPDHDLF